MSCVTEYVFICFFFSEIWFLCSPGCLGTHSLEQAASASSVMERHASPPPGCILFLLKDSCLFLEYEHLPVGTYVYLMHAVTTEARSGHRYHRVIVMSHCVGPGH